MSIPAMGAPGSDSALCPTGPVGRFLGSRTFLAGVLLLAAALRVAHVLSLRKLPLFDLLIVDSWMYDEIAQRIVGGELLGGADTSYIDPLYPYFLAGLYRTFGRDLLLVRLLQSAMGVGTCALVAVGARRFGGPVAGNLAALLAAISAPAIFQEGEVEKTALGLLFVSAALVLAMTPGNLSRFGAGVALGIATLTRGNLMLMVPLGVVWFLSDPFDRSDGLPRLLRIRRALLGRPAFGAALFLVGFLLALFPSAWRNHARSGRWVLTTSGAGPTLYMGNNPYNELGSFVTLPFVRPNTMYEEEDFRAAAEARLGRPLTQKEVSAYWLEEALAHIRSRPGFAVRVWFRKLALFWSDYEIPDAWDMEFLARYSPALRLPFLVSLATLAPLAAAGVVLGRRRREVRLLAGFVVVHCLAVTAFLVFGRYRIHVFPPLAMLGGVGLVELAGHLRAKRIREILPAAVVALGFLAFALFGIDRKQTREASALHSRVNLAEVHAARNQPEPALELLGEVVALAPRHAGALVGIGKIHLAAGRFVPAEEFLRRGIAADRLFPGAWSAIGELFERTGRPELAARAYGEELANHPGDEKTTKALAGIEERRR